MNKLPLLIFVIFVIAGCRRGEPMNTEDRTYKGPYLPKSNFRTAEKNGFTVEVWTSGRLGNMVAAGFRIDIGKNKPDQAPKTTLHLRLRREFADDDEFVVSVTPTLKKTILEGGYWENIRVDNLNHVDRPEKFTGREGVWEVNLDDPFNAEVKMKLQKKSSYPDRGKYLLTMELSIENGPSFRFENLPYRIVTSGDPSELKD